MTTHGALCRAPKLTLRGISLANAILSLGAGATVARSLFERHQANQAAKSVPWHCWRGVHQSPLIVLP